MNYRRSAKETSCFSDKETDLLRSVEVPRGREERDEDRNVGTQKSDKDNSRGTGVSPVT